MLGKHHRYLTLEKRYKIKELLDQQCSMRKIAKEIGVSPTTVSRELGRTKGEAYDPEYAEIQSQLNQQGKGREAIIALDKELAQYIAKEILGGNSPEKVVDLIKNNSDCHFATVSVNTIYRAIDVGLIPDVTRETLQRRETKMFSNGMVCVPKWIRELLGLSDGDIFHITLSDTGEIVLKKQELQ